MNDTIRSWLFFVCLAGCVLGISVIVIAFRGGRHQSQSEEVIAEEDSPSGEHHFSLAGKGPDTKLYPKVDIATVFTGKWKRPRCLVEGVVSWGPKKENDGDFHFRVSDGTHELVCEIVPEHSLLQPKIGDRVRVAGIPRADGEHSWWEIHPVFYIAIVPK